MKVRAVLLLVLSIGLGAFQYLSAPLGRDYAPGQQFMAAPFVAPTACPARRWQPDDYMPRACADGPGHIVNPYSFGLGSTRQGRSSFRDVRWVRGGPDALLVECALGACRVEEVLTARFISPPGGDNAVADPDVKDYRRAPLLFVLGRLAEAMFLPLIGAAGLALMLMRRPLS